MLTRRRLGTLPLDDSFNVLVTTLAKGAQLYPLVNLDSYNNTANSLVTSAISGTLIPTAWALSNEQHHPFIMYASLLLFLHNSGSQPA